ncbi:MAG: AI-2E family transporter [Candidatus Promineifilaceae bacterium]|nr:AI-2E family transporter [Candidatus Promineifilaceae bacterium]
MKLIAKYTAVILATLTVLVVLWQFKLILLLFVLSLFVAAAIRPFVEVLVERGLSKGAAQLILYLIGLLLFALFLLFAGELFLREFNTALNRTVLHYESLYSRWQNGEAWQQTAAEQLPPPLTYTEVRETELGEFVPVVMTIMSSMTGALGGLLLLLALSVYWGVDQYRFERLWLSLLPATRRAYFRDSWRSVEMAVGQYLRQQSLQSLLTFILVAIGAAIIGFDFPLLLGVVGALAAFLPLIGGLLTAVFALALGSLQSWPLAFAAAVITLLIFIGIELIVEPRLQPYKRRRFLLIILVMLPMLETFGIWGLIMTPPLAAGLEALSAQIYKQLMAKRQRIVQLKDLEARYQKLTLQIAESENESISPEVKNLSERLAELLHESRNLELNS